MNAKKGDGLVLLFVIVPLEILFATGYCLLFYQAAIAARHWPEPLEISVVLVLIAGFLVGPYLIFEGVGRALDRH